MRSVRETKIGGVFVELMNTVPKHCDALAEAIKSAVADAGGVRTLARRLTWEIRDVDTMVTKGDVEAAVKSCFAEGVAPGVAV